MSSEEAGTRGVSHRLLTGSSRLCQGTFQDARAAGALPLEAAGRESDAVSQLPDDELTDRWERQELGGSGVSHIDHVRVAWVLHRRHGQQEAEERLVEGTRKGCEHYGVPDKFDELLTGGWATVISSAAAGGPTSENFEEFIERNPELRRGDLFETPREVPTDLDRTQRRDGQATFPHTRAGRRCRARWHPR